MKLTKRQKKEIVRAFDRLKHLDARLTERFRHLSEFASCSKGTSRGMRALVEKQCCNHDRDLMSRAFFILRELSEKITELPES